MLTERETIIDLIRHGEPVGGSRYRGYGVDDPLSESGWQQMWDAVGENVPWLRIVSSPMRRCSAFAEALGNRQGLPVLLDEGLREVGFGSWEGRTAAEIKRASPNEYEAFYSDPVHSRPRGAEPLGTFVSRVTESYNRTLDNAAGQHVLIVTHAGVIRAVIASVLGSELQGMYRVNVRNAGITRIRHTSFGGHLEFHNSPDMRLLEVI